MVNSAVGDALSPWRFGRLDGGRGKPKLLFGKMFEDAAIERRVFPPGGRVFCIASAGYIALELARPGFCVTAVDINPCQIAYVGRRLKGGPCERGVADRRLDVARRAAWCCGIRREELLTFLELDDPSAQLRFWKERIDHSALRRAARILFSQKVLRLVYAAPLVRAFPNDFGDILWSRLERGIGTHPNRANPHAWRLFLGRDREGSREPAIAGEPLELNCSDAADYLENCPAGIFHGFSLSNILDGADAAYATRLSQSLRHAAAENAVVVLRSFAEPRSKEEDELAATDRSLLWGRIVVRPVAELDAELLTWARRPHEWST